MARFRQTVFSRTVRPKGRQAPKVGGASSRKRAEGYSQSHIRMNGKQAKPQPGPKELDALKTRVKQLNKLVGQHQRSGLESGRPATTPASPSGGGAHGGGSHGAGSPSAGAGIIVPAVKTTPKVAKAPKTQPKQQPPQPTPVMVKTKDGMHLMPLANPPVKAMERQYKASDGRVVATTQVVPDFSHFAKRLNAVKSPSFIGKAVGIAESQLYHGSKPMESDFVRNGIRGTRLAGSQYLDTVKAESNIGIGQRLTFCLVNPIALGSVLAKLAQTFEQVKFNHLKVVYKPVVPTTTTGSIAFYFRNDVNTPMLSVGLDELNSAATHQAFIETTVWNAASIDIKPSDVALKYWDEMTGVFSEEVQGMIVVIATSTLTAGATYGHLYLEYDAEFYAPELDTDVEEVDVLFTSDTWTSYVATGGTTMTQIYQAAAAPLPTAAWIGDTLPSTEFVGYGVVTAITGTPPQWITVRDPTPRDYALGQGFYVNFGELVAGTWTDGSRYMHLFTTPDSIGTSDGGSQVLYAASGTFTGSITLRLRFYPDAPDAP
nr:MAG: hypothetical protein 2 [Sobelivirales sp.]